MDKKFNISFAPVIGENERLATPKSIVFENLIIDFNTSICVFYPL